MYRKGDRLVVEIEKLVFGGAGLARLPADNSNDKKLVIFVENVTPGDQVEIEIFAIKRNLAKAKAIRFIKLSTERVKPPCPHFGQTIDESGQVWGNGFADELDLSKNCGGCSWQFLPYEKQLEVKEKEVWDALRRIGNFDEDQLKKVWKTIMPAENPWYYRNKMEFSIALDKKTGQRHFGLHMRGRYWEVTEIKECLIAWPWLKNFLEPMRKFLAEVELGEGELKSLIVRAGTNTGEVMVNLLVENSELDWANDFWQIVSDLEYGEDRLVSVFLTSITNKKGQPKKFAEELLWGKPVFREKLKLNDGRILNFEIAPQAFLQPNTTQAEKFYSLVGELAGLTGVENVFDLFCGTGTIGLTLATKAKKVVGVELNAEAITNAKKNAEINSVENVQFLVGDATKILPELSKEVDVLVVDPPRAGLNPKIIQTISDTTAQKVIYVSCNPATLARDLKEFVERGWELDFVQPIDQFSQTYHVETVTTLKR